MIGTEFLKGQGLGNQLFCYVTARAIASKKGVLFGTAGRNRFGYNIHNEQGMYFMDIDLGHNIEDSEIHNFTRYDEADERLYLGTFHDLKHGCYISGADEKMKQVDDGTLLYGNMQDESYFADYYDELKSWLRVRKEYDCYEYSRENLCILNMRGGEYFEQAEFTLRRNYWLGGMRKMRTIRADMEFMIITDDPLSANKILPEIPAYHFDIAKDFTIIKNAYYLLLSNSSFACMPAFLSETAKYIIAPKYWGRYNGSNGYWCSEQNIYRDFHYMDRKGRIFSSSRCRKELNEYKKNSPLYRKVNQYPKGLSLIAKKIHAYLIHGEFWLIRVCYSLRRRLRSVMGIAARKPQ
ncbi:MAG: glycosyl transferase [Lachnospiraceae bacterium]|nr:glycosyl transferase [Lachnospiraceae bacterium]